MILYPVIARLFGMAADLFYRRRHLGGAVPADGPLLVVANHPNGLVDPVVVMRVAGRRVRFLAKEPLFRMPVIGWLLRAVGALPVYRAKDGHDTGANAGMFDAVNAALCRGEAICLFPEGVSHDEPSLQPLKTGAARMALGSQAPVRVVPVGLNYRDKGRFRGEVAVQVGVAVEVSAYRDAADPVGALTDAIAAAIREVTVNLDAWEDAPLLELAGRIWPGDDDPAVRLRVFAEAHRSFLTAVPDRVASLRRRLVAFGAALAALGMKDPAELDLRYRPSGVARFVARNLSAVLVGLPLAALGAIAYAPPYQAVRPLVAGLRPEADVVATVKLLGSMVLFAAWQVALSVGLVACLGPLSGLCVALALPLCGVYTHHFLERRADALRALRLFLRLPVEAALRRELRRERDEVRAEIEALADLR